MAIQVRFGEYEPSFFGVTFRFASPRAWNAYREFNRNPHPADPVHLAEEEYFEALAVASVASHEVRHFHDALLSPYGARIALSRVYLFANLLQTLPRLLGSGNCLPVPLSRWCRMGDDARRAELAWLPARTDGQPWTPVAVPHVDPDDGEAVAAGPVRVANDAEHFEKLLRASFRLRRSLERFTFNPRLIGGGTSFQPWQVFELSALMTQSQEVYTTFGLGAANRFLKFLQRSENTYAWLLRLCDGTFAKVRAPMDAAMLTAMATWCILGSYEEDGQEACPAERFVHLWHAVVHGRARVEGNDFAAVFAEWSAATGLNDVDAGLEESRRVFRRLWEELEGGLHTGSPFLRRMAAVLRELAAGLDQASDHMVRCFRASPERYLHPLAYLNSVAELPNPWVRIAFDGCGIPLATFAEELEREGYVVQWGTEEDGGGLAVTLLAPFRFSPFVFISRESAATVADLVALTDFLFAESGRARPELRRVGETFFRPAGIEPVELL